MTKEDKVKQAHAIIAQITQNLTDLADLLITGSASQEHAVKNEKKRRDPNAPKSPASNFFIFTNSIREEVEKAHPEANFTEKSKIYGRRWQQLSEEEKKPFSEQAKREREKYNKEMAIYEAKNGEHVEKKAKKESAPAKIATKAAPAAAKATPTKTAATKATPAKPAATKATPAKPAATKAAPKATPPAKKAPLESSSDSDSESSDDSSDDSDSDST